MTTLSILKVANKSHWLDALYWFALIVGFSMLPLWGTWLILSLLKKAIVITDLMAHGEFYIYSAAFMAQSLYTLLVIRYRISLGIVISIFLLVICVLLFASVIISEKAKAESGSTVLSEFLALDFAFLKLTSIIILSLALLIAFYTKLIDNIKSLPPIREFQDNSLKDLENDLEEIQK